jgi:manganese/zinc/iron transport system ATP- binding protein
MNAKPLFVLDHVSVGYRQRAVLSEVQLQLPAGSFTALLGGNGSGKTTLLKTLAGILPPLAGRVVYPERDGRALILGYVPQRESLDALFLLSAFEVALMGTYGRIRAGRLVSAQEKAFTVKCLRLTGAEEFASQQFSRLSGGQKQRVLIARALAARPHLLLLDEPTAGIDAAAAQAIMEVLSALHREQGLNVLWVTHDLATVRRYADTVIWLKRGQVLQGPVTELMTPDKITELLELSWG